MLWFVLFLASFAIANALRPGHRFPREMSMEERLKKARDYPALGLRKSLPIWTPEQVPFFDHGLDHEVQFHEELWMAWTADEDNNTITITVALHGLGYIALGPTQTGSMVGLNPCVIREWPLGSGVMVAQAMHSDTFTTPTLNEVQNCRLVEYIATANESMATFTRPMIGCKAANPPEDTDYTGRWDMRIAAAWGDDMNFIYHGIERRATREFHILDGIYVPLPLPDDVEIFRAQLLPMYLPDYRDIYFCRGFQFPQDRRYHVVRMDPYLPGDIYPAAYHHLLVFQCPNGLPEEYLDPDYMAKCPVIPSASCFSYFGGWALGGGNQYFDKFGLPIGVGDGTPKVFLLQTHIDNPNSDPTIYEPGWGFVFYYTATLRPVEGGTFGMYSGTPLFGIPPQQENFTVQSECTDRIISTVFPDGIYLESVFTHMHGLGRASTVEIIRGNDRTGWAQLQNPWESDYYDTNWQGSRLLQQPGYRVEAGDKLRITCSFNTMSKNEPTRNGEGFDDEMCIQYIFYYPARTDRRPISICAEFPPGIGISFSDVNPNFALIGQYDYEPFPIDNGVCTPPASQPLSQ